MGPNRQLVNQLTKPIRWEEMWGKYRKWEGRKLTWDEVRKRGRGIIDHFSVRPLIVVQRENYLFYEELLLWDYRVKFYFPLIIQVLFFDSGS